MKHVLSMLEETVERFKDKTAVIEEDQSCTYGQLQQNSKAIATDLIQQNVFREPVIVFMDKGIGALYAFFGSAYAGNLYSLLNPEFPSVRLEQIQSVLRSQIVLTTQTYKEKATEVFKDTKILLIEDLIETPVDAEAVSACMKKTLDIDPLYVNFTSGSTGVPKGVLISHGSVIDFIETFVQTFAFSSNERFGNQAPFDFDVSVKDIYTCMKTGATLVIIPRKYFSSPTALLDYLCDHEVTTMVWAVSALSLICAFHGLEYRVPEKVQKILFSGEVMPYKHMMAWKQALPKVQLVNLYGPTEITCNCTYHVLEDQRDYTGGIPIGLPFENKEVFLLNEENHRIQEPGVTGEICVKGRGLALGYYRNPEQTQAHFMPDPLCEAYPQRMYRTGDLAYYNDQKELVFQGRKDFQIKYMGHRIELEEIERKALQIHDVHQFCCLFDEKKHRLYGFYAGNVKKEELTLKLRESLPVFMIPSKLFQIEHMPLTKNGKTDRKQLMELTKGGRRR